ncbi:protein-glutamate O-methyltransferase CheR [Mucilaginibacter sp. RS28]|uniref:Protein-glutamate O-methyltransferase CheR n=1 Tax=Mucilaginibacter straminoryzae TaxID=2932774 RepID=A0A9X1X0P4_9SPHI|nr:protein-glutamate O-methyltransferase CheR [Mucilaginibacter straminoryzae]MCJ8208631.1 protein-glutamate O-methyltransferase CheR [Mucilaginibacter straminoryzae]
MPNSRFVVTAEEMTELVALVNKLYDFDFSQYSKASFKRRLVRLMELKRLTFYDLKHELVNSPAFFQEFLDEITVNVTEMFRDPAFYKSLLTQVLPYLNSFNRVNIWSAGCSTGEELYSISILLKEAGLKNKTLLYGTDINTSVIKTAKKGIYQLSKVKSYAANYQATGLPGSITQHFTMMYDAAIIQAELKQYTTFSVHNLLSDGVFNQFHLISCRNVFIYFEPALQEKILGLFYESLVPFGFLCLGSRETLRSDYFRKKFRVIDQQQNIYQKITQ